MPYPDGTGATDSRAPWNKKEPPECHNCHETIFDERDHAQSCDLDGYTAGEVRTQKEENARAERAERQMEQQRVEERLSQT